LLDLEGSLLEFAREAFEQDHGPPGIEDFGSCRAARQQTQVGGLVPQIGHFFDAESSLASALSALKTRGFVIDTTCRHRKPHRNLPICIRAKDASFGRQIRMMPRTTGV
jgi:hypothetical protein